MYRLIFPTGTRVPRISRKSILRNKSQSTSSSSVGYRPGESNIICKTSTTLKTNAKMKD